MTVRHLGSGPSIIGELRPGDVAKKLYVPGDGVEWSCYTTLGGDWNGFGAAGQRSFMQDKQFSRTGRLFQGLEFGRPGPPALSR